MFKRNGNSRIRLYSFWGMVIFYLIAGLNHFVVPEFYYPLIPPYFPFPKLINGLSGILEIVLAIGLLFPKSRKFAVLGIIILLLLFVPAHIHFIRLGSCLNDSLCVAPWIAWLRLLVIHPLLIFWTYSFKNYRKWS